MKFLVQFLEGVGVPADAAAQGELLAGGGVLHVQRAVLLLHRRRLGRHRALRQLRLRNIRHSLEVVVTGLGRGVNVTGVETGLTLQKWVVPKQKNTATEQQ